MTDDNPKVGNIIVVDAGTIGRVLKVDGSSVVIHALDFPYFRVIPTTTFDLTTIKIAETMNKALQQLVLPTLSKDWSIESWENEVDDLVEYVRDDLEEEHDNINTENKAIQAYIWRKAKAYVKDSEWVSDPTGQEKCIKFSVQYLSVTPEMISAFLDEKQKHIWTAVRKASAMAHLVNDVYEQLMAELQEDYDDDDDQDSDDYDSED